ncbi:ArsR/SmtB family transcription factor [Thalassotalea agarivorans]|uniref:DNA-binding transcriptional regulator, ArsR family n=1 Tax=Thalassotalea agarivorans TaxID=349064 RepID=A0A1I0AJ25_THASX|nr:metalloregulator ArsR/SmtB family transcription factor [Thalassotalea agarivorans]SES94349.1 DNA-binding transcriptional regulator, ArsR family [Thalassotalea agarivorans]
MTHPLDKVYLALSDETRRNILTQLCKGRSTISALAAPYNMSLAAVSKHVKKLEQAGLVYRQVEGRTHFIYLQAEALAGAYDWVSAYQCFWQQRLDLLASELTQKED